MLEDMFIKDLFPPGSEAVSFPLMRRVQGGGLIDWDEFTGNPVQFLAPKRHTLKSVKAYFSPKQDLHGQDAPYPAGGRKNKYEPKFYENVQYNKETGGTINQWAELNDVTKNGNTYSRAVASWGQMCMIAPLEDGVTYTFSATLTGTSLALCLYILDSDRVVTRILNEGTYSPDSPYSLNKTL